MGSNKKPKPTAQKGRNADRRCGKAFKQNPGVSEKTFTGRTHGGYSDLKLLIRQERRALVRMAADL